MHMHTCRYIVPTCTCMIHEHDSASIAYMQYVPMVDVPTCTVHVQGIASHMYKLCTYTSSIIHVANIMYMYMW